MIPSGEVLFVKDLPTRGLMLSIVLLSVVRRLVKVYIPVMKHFVLEFKNLAGQQRGAASICNASESVLFSFIVFGNHSVG